MRKNVLFTVLVLTGLLASGLSCERERAPITSYRRDGSPPINPRTDGGSRDSSTTEDTSVDASLDATVDASADSKMDASLPQSLSVPATGQDQCYAVTGDALECAGSGQDGELTAGSVWPTPRFAAAQSGTIVDNLTGLEWLIDGNCISNEYAGFDDQDTQSQLGDGIVNWPYVLEFAKGVNDGTYSNCAAGKTGWRAPNINELQSLFSAGESAPAAWLEAQGFANVRDGLYWSATPSAGNATDAWIMDFSTGEVVEAWKAQDYGATMLVRGVASTSVASTGVTTCSSGAGFAEDCAGTGQDGEYQTGLTSPVPRFTDHGDGTTTDAFTGLMWLTDATCVSNYPTAEGNGFVDHRLTWTEAFNFVDGVNVGTYADCAATYDDWRLPNRNELQSVLSYAKRNPATATDLTFENISDFEDALWTSTTVRAEPANAWQLLVFTGSIAAIDKTEEHHVVLVRNATQ